MVRIVFGVVAYFFGVCVEGFPTGLGWLLTITHDIINKLLTSTFYYFSLVRVRVRLRTHNYLIYSKSN